MLGHGVLENRDEGVYAYCSFNDSESGQAAKKLVQHGDVRSLSICAGQLKQAGANVVHGVIYELSLVLAGANPGAFIDSVMAHGETSEDRTIIGYDENIMIYHSAEEDDKSEEKKTEEKSESKEDKTSEEKPEEDDETIEQVFNTLNEKQKNVVYAMIGQAIGETDEPEDKNDDDSKGGNTEMKHNVFDNDKKNETGGFLTALVLAAVGALAQIPGLEWLIGEGGNLLQGIGTAIGKFVGGIVGGFMSGVSSQFPQIGADLSAFMTNVQPFIEGATQLNPSMLDGVKALAETILILTAADILNGLTSWLTGGSSLSDFATQLVPFGEAMRDFSIAIAGMDGELVANAATAGRTLAEMAATLPNSGGVIGFFTGENDMSAFGAQLIPFGEAMMGFANAVRGLDADTVTNAATAGKAMAEMATTIPNSGGVVGFFAGENDMDAFGEQLVPFGKAMMLFSQAVKGLDANVIVESATAGKALIELANTVPNSGGVVGFFTGENDMDTFGEKLVPFGKAMKSYSDAIAGIDVEAVTNSATAGKAVVELANTLPNTGGLVSWFTGDNDIAAFGTSLVSFGKSFAQYSDYMKDVDANIVTTTTNAATSIVELQKSLPKEGGWFSDDMTLASFGSDMASFGAHFSNYYNSISGIDTTLLSGVITQTNRLVSMANGMVGLDTSGMTSFSSALTTLGETGVTGFINAFNNAESKVTAAASSMLSSFINGANAKKSELTTTFTTLVQAVLTAINGKQGEFQTSGSTLMVKFIAGVRSQDSPSRTTFTNIVSGCLTAIRNKYGEFTSTGTQTMVKLIAGVRSQDSSARMAFTTIISACLTVIKNKYAEFTSTGRECMVKFIAGVRSKDSELRTAFTTTLSGSITAIKDYYSQFKSAGSYLVDGFCDGISENTWKAEAKARAMAAAAAEAAEDELDEHSPSKRFYGIGNFAGVGFINALIDNVSKAGKAGQEIARTG